MLFRSGAYSADNPIDMFDNMRRGMRLAYDCLKAGFAPFVPWFDYHFSLIGEMSIEEYYTYSMAWLEVSDAVLVQPVGVEKSRGTLKEIQRAQELGIPVFNSLEVLCKWNARFYVKPKD